MLLRRTKRRTWKHYVLAVERRIILEDTEGHLVQLEGASLEDTKGHLVQLEGASEFSGGTSTYTSNKAPSRP
jgi:hypothetical protein